jgi:hypothetical protein
MRIKLRQSRWTLERMDLGPNVRGNIDHPDRARRYIRVSTRLTRGEEILEVMLHEFLHGCFWDMDEEVITEAARDIARALYRCGARVDLDKLPVRKSK